MKEVELIKQFKLFIVGLGILITSCLFFLIIKGSLYYDLANFFTDKTYFKVINNIELIMIFIGLLLMIFSFIIDEFKNYERNIIIAKIMIIINILCCLFVFIISNIFLVLPISGSSMTPTIHDGDRVVLLCTNIVKRNDIVIFEVNSDDNLINYGTSKYIKRVIGLPGDEITYIDKVLKINGKIVEETYFPSDYLSGITEYEDFKGIFKYKEKDKIAETTIIPEGYIFVLGDNRHLNGSNDSMEIGLIPINNIIGIVK